MSSNNNIISINNSNAFTNIYDKIKDKNITINEKLSILNDFKGHVKKELVNVELVQLYFNTLLYIPNNFKNQPTLLSLSHSSLCYLVKRVAYQSPNSINNELVNRLMHYFIHIQYTIITNNNSTSNNNNNNNNNIEKKFWLLSNKTLETIYLTVPLYVEDCLLKLFIDNLDSINHNFSNISAESQENIVHLKYLLLIIDDLTRINLQSASSNNTNISRTTTSTNNTNKLVRNPILFLEMFIPYFVKLLNNNKINGNNNFKLIIELINDILAKYLDTNLFNNFKNQLIDDHVKSLFNKDHNKDQSNLPNIEGKKIINDDHHNSNNNNNNNPLLNSDTKMPINNYDLQVEYQLLLNNYKAPQLTNLINQNHLKYKVPHNSIPTFINDLSQLLIPFDDIKETEKNWKLRQSNIISIREKLLINENLIKENKDEFVANLKDIKFIECISKAISSLRTSLSLNGSQLLLDLFPLLGDSLTIQLLDQCFSLLRSLLSSTKKLSSQMAFHCLIIMFINTDEFYNKLFQNCLILLNEKNITPRNASAIFLRLFIIKFNKTSRLNDNLIYMEEWLKKGIQDPQITVRESFKTTFWYFYYSYPKQAKYLSNNSLSSQLKKTLEPSLPSHLNVNYEKQIFQSNSSSRNNSRRSSLLGSNFQHPINNINTNITNNNSNKRKYPSYAQPTQASSVSRKQNTSILRSTSESIMHNNNSNDYLNESNSKKFKPNTLPIKRKVSAPPIVKNASLGQLDKMETDNLNQFDLTDEIMSPQTNSLIKKYIDNVPLPKVDTNINMEDKHVSGNQNMSGETTELKKDPLTVDAELANIVVSFKSNPNNFLPPLQLLYNILLKHPNHNIPESIMKELLPFTRQIMMKNHSALTNLLSIPTFVKSLPLTYQIELFAISNLNADKLLLNTKFENSNNFIDEICNTFKSLLSINTTTEASIFYMKYREKIFNFTFTLLITLINANSKEFILSDIIFEKLLLQVCDIYGNEFDSKLYFDLLFKLYQHNSKVFIFVLTDLNLVSKKLKISNELQQRDPNFELPERKSNNNSIDNDIKIENDDDTQVKGLMEMTMVNPFNPNRKKQTNATMHKEEDTDSLGIMEPRISEMTKVISVYQSENTRKLNLSHSNDDVSENVDFNTEKRSDLDLTDIFSNKRVESKHKEKSETIPSHDKGDMAEKIGLNNDAHKPDSEHTVKFSTDPPKIIDDEMATMDKENMSIENSNDNRNIDDTTNLQIQSPDSTLKPILSYSTNSNQSTENIDINPVISTEISAEQLMEYNNSILSLFPKESLTFFELSTLFTKASLTISNRTTKFEIQFRHLVKAINRIKNGTFTMKHLNYLIEPFIGFTVEDSFLVKWLENDGGYSRLLEICLVLLQSTHETLLIPTNMTSKALILLQCLVITNSKLKKVETFTSNLFSKIWDQFLSLVEKLNDSNNEIYILLLENRRLMVKMKFFDSKGITKILSKLLVEIFDYEEEIKKRGENDTEPNIINMQINQKTKKGAVTSFLLGLLSEIFRDNEGQQTTVFKMNQLSEIIQTLEPFTRQELTEWKFESCNVLAQIYRVVSTMEHSNAQNLDAMFQCLSAEQYKLVRFMASRR